MAYRAIRIEVIAIMSQSHVTYPQSVVVPQNAAAVAYLMQPFYANQARNLSISKDWKNVVHALHEFETMTVSFDDAMNQINLLKGITCHFEVILVREIVLENRANYSQSGCF